MTTGDKAASGNGTTQPKSADKETGKAVRNTEEGFPVVGIGASAGGLAAFEAFFSGVSAGTNPGMAFVLVQHLAPDHKSILTDIIGHYTHLEVFEVSDGMAVRPNCVYIIPPNRDMAILNGTLQLMEPSAPHGHRLPIDFFFRSLALDQRERAICVVLSGTGSDGTMGLRAVKDAGGMAMAQTPDSTEYRGMPQSALATGLVDFTLPPAEMPAKIAAYATHAIGGHPLDATAQEPGAGSALAKVFVLLRVHTGHDFSQYKPNTIHRRIERRMAVHQIGTMDGYVKYLQRKPAEVDALFRDILIGVTNFFRDPEAFQALEAQAIQTLLEGKPAGSVVRVWVPGCSTGEEAYSIAILLQERLDSLNRNCKAQIFATDIDSKAIATARAGRYPASIVSDIAPERLARHFTLEPDDCHYRIKTGVREMLVFSEQDVIKDPPFTKLDLISCRNLMIYLDTELQDKLIPLFHYALNPGGILFLGTSESVGGHDFLFAPLDRKSKLYLRREGLLDARHPSTLLMPLFRKALHATVQPLSGKMFAAGKRPLRELTEQALLQQVAPAGALVNAHGDILYLHGRTGMYLEPPPGETRVNNILKMAREGLRTQLAKALHMAATENTTTFHMGLRIKTNGDFTTANLTVCPVAASPESTPEAPLYLVILEEAAPIAPGPPPAPKAEQPGLAEENLRISLLMEDLQAREEHLQTALEELETTNEELQSVNEEMQSVNEELQSTNEELETSKEELQSVNEELITVNAELQGKMVEMARANNDLNNLMSGTGIGTVFVDHQLRILRFTPAATWNINLIPNDVGRPLSNIASNMVGYECLVEDTQSVLETLIPREVDVRTKAGAWYRLRILPYRTLENVIEGAVITFSDITELKESEEALRKANDQLRLAAVARDAHDGITVQDLDGRILAWNPGAARMYGWSEAEALAMSALDRIPEGLRDGALAMLMRLGRAEVLEPCHTQRLTKEGAIVDVSIVSTPLMDEEGNIYAIATTERASTPDAL